MAQVTLTEFLLARIAEDEAVARKTAPVDHRWDYTLWVRFDSTRVLAECEAKRRIVELAQGSASAAERIIALDDDIAEAIARTAQTVTEAVLLLLSTVYADHEGYLPEWKP